MSKIRLVTKNGFNVGIPASTKEHMMAHADVDFNILAEAISKIKYDGGFYKCAIDLGRVIGKTACVVIDNADTVEYYYRKNRAGVTPFVKNREMEETTKVVVIMREGKWSPILITAYYGDLAPMEPWDARRKQLDDDEIEKCDIFWSKHALVYDENAIDFEKNYILKEG